MMQPHNSYDCNGKDGSSLPPLSINIDFGETAEALVFFDLETSGLNEFDDVLQIAAKCGNKVFNEYISPKSPIPQDVFPINGLSGDSRGMFLHGKLVLSLSLKTILTEFLEFLRNLNKRCVLIAHNCFRFDAPRLSRIIRNVNMQDDFAEVVSNFVDTLPLFQEKFRRRSCRLISLAEDSFTLEKKKAHNAMYDVLMLENVTFKNFSVAKLLRNRRNFSQMVYFPEV